MDKNFCPALQVYMLCVCVYTANKIQNKPRIIILWQPVLMKEHKAGTEDRKDGFGGTVEILKRLFRQEGSRQGKAVNQGMS
jgi:hypothetical protein